jgi:outer membrane cobalamin receptor
MDSFIREDLSLNFNIFKTLKGNFKIENLFNSSYEEVYGYKALGRRAIFGLKSSF